mmetsp:Transcript_9543/g.15897  ORF Transcript_9543/g.15897 Transcript_9543/m.15897 type:complete len:670 (+) Transcript_9543:467-2476(+)|eukprot:CAMPEP_0119021744 /NCGR_PEP_ID=MMETSP1176-20130426/26607_1 /TAXON_ID=265551 /ORGANISM="Synedropsis recta cf, Strain CCMP1620" /LENGTH=669 /DNA_ID=CAMNT_0006976427 /DNA_START=375 /DNA_END=2384 /DNA_ORIENTATION=+
MGNETSVPEDDGLQPPSQIPPPADSATDGSMRVGGKAVKLAKAVLQKATDRGDHSESSRTSTDGGYPGGEKFYTAQEQYKISPKSSASSSPQQQYYSNNSNGGGYQKGGDELSPHSSIPVMFASEGGVKPPPPPHNAAAQAANSIRTGGKAVRNGGRAIMNSMRNLTVATSGSGKNMSAPRSGGLKREENEWETNWDEDGEDSSSEEEEEQQGAVPSPPKQKQPSRPPNLAVSQKQKQQQQQQSSPLPQLPTLAPSQGIAEVLLENNLAIRPKPPVSEKPNVQMFLPLLRVLGKGSFGKVVLCQKRKGIEQGTLFAMKILRKTHLVKKRQIERTRTERKVLSVVDHPFIMKLHFAFQTELKLYLVLDYCPGGELFFHLSRFRRFPERVAKFYAAELLLAIGHLHKRGIIYRDLKPENVLLDAEGHVKLGDFGLAKAGIRHSCEGATSMCGTPEYMAPEVLNQQGHGFCVDYWGLGMLTYEMMTGLPPWYTTDRAKLFRRLKSAQLDIPSYFTAQAASCVSQFLQRDPRRRLGSTGIRTAMEHEFFRTINWRALYARRVAAPILPCEGWKPPGDEPQTQQIGDDALDAATANFDNAFTRMKLDTEENPNQDGGDPSEDHSEASEELHEGTFLGFTFDVDNADALHNSSSGQQQKASRQRSERYKNSSTRP